MTSTISPADATQRPGRTTEATASNQATPHSPWVIGGVALALVVQMTPFYVALTTAFKPRTDTSSLWLPPVNGATLQNFSTALDAGNLVYALENSLVVTVATTLLTCAVGAMAAYPLARRPTALNRLVSLAILGVLMVPPLSVLVPLYTMLSQWGLLNTFGGLVAVLTATQLPLAIFLFTQFMRGLPVSLEEAAAIDGAGLATTFTRIVLPSLKPVLATVAILTATNVWNEFALSSYLMTRPEMRTLAPAVASFFSAQQNNVGAAAAAALIGLIPIVTAYLFLQRYFIKGALAGAEK